MKRLFALLLAAVMVLSMAACSQKNPESTTAPTEETTAPTEPSGSIATPGEGVYTKESYTVSTEELNAQNATVVATIGESQLTVGQLQVYYWMSVYGFLQDYSYYLSYFGLDASKALDAQECPENDGTWQQYFLKLALDSWHNYQSLALVGQEEGVQMDEQLKKEMETLASDMATAAEEGKFESIDAMIEAQLGPGITFEDYKAYQDVYYTGYSYFTKQYDAIEITDEMIEAYYTEHEADLKAKDITKEEGKLVNVRHILLTPEGGTQGEDGRTTYTDAQWEACRVKAQNLMDGWLNGPATEEGFAELANEHSTDPGSNTKGGLYEGVATGDMVEEFDAWCFDEGRNVGDCGLVKTTYGYHIMYYSGDEAKWISECRKALMDEKTTEIVVNAAQAHPMTVEYDNIVLGHVDLVSSESGTEGETE